MHSANAYLLSVAKIDVGSHLSSDERQALNLRLMNDAKDYYQASLVTLVDGLRSIQSGFFSWATIKLYYSVFYAVRSRLAIAGECIFYDGNHPRFLGSSAAAAVTKLKGNTHQCVLSKFSSLAPYDFFLSQEIAGSAPLMWLEERRVEVNYRQSRFSEPSPSEFLQYAASTDLRQMLASYAAEDVYIHDQEHALVAFPFRLLIDLRSRLLARAVTPLNQAELKFLSEQIRDKAGTIIAMKPLLS